MLEVTPAVRKRPWPQSFDEPSGSVRYTLAAAAVTMLTYSFGYSTIGFGLLLFGDLWSLREYRNLRWSRTAVDLPLGVFGAVLLLSALASPFPAVALQVTSMLILSGIVYFGSFAYLLRAVPAARTQLFKIWAIGALMAAAVGLAYGVAERAVSPASAAQRIEIPRGVGPNGLGTTLMLGALVSLALAFRSPGRERLAWVAAELVCLGGLFATGSRASLVGWIGGAAYLVWRESRGRLNRIAGIVSIGVALLLGISTVAPQLANRLPSTLSDISGNRLRIWRSSLDMIAARPLLGSGFGTFERAYDQRRPAGMSREPFAFNLWLNLAVEVGLVGLAAALFVALKAVQIWRRRRSPGAETDPALDPWRCLIVALWIGLLVDQFADNTVFSISTSAALWLLLALVAVDPLPSANPGAAGCAASSGGR